MPSGIAEIRVDLEMVQFDAAFQRYLKLASDDVEYAVSKTALQLLERIQMKTPVDTGRLRASFHAVLPGQGAVSGTGQGSAVADRYLYTDRFGRTFDGSLGVKARNVDLTRSWGTALAGYAQGSLTPTSIIPASLGGAFQSAGENTTVGVVEAWVGTNVEYAIYIEAGHSRKAPQGMVAISVAEMTGALERAVEQALGQGI